MKRAAAILFSLVNDLLDIAKKDVGAMELELEMVIPADVINSTISIMSSQSCKKNSLNTTVDTNVPVIYADGKKCKQIMFNLFSDGLKYTPEGGNVGVVIKRRIDSFTSNKVIDTGIGIKYEDQENIYSEFHQTDRVWDEQPGGTEIGFALRRQLIELHGEIIGVKAYLPREVISGLCFP